MPVNPTRLGIEVSTAIERPTDLVFEFVANYENDPRWRAGVESMRHDPPGPVHVGMHTHEILRFFGRTLRVEAEITSLEAGRSVAFRTLAGPLEAEGIRRVGGTASGTRVTYEAAANLTGLLSLMSPLVAWSFRRRAQADLARLRRILESESNPEAP